jgi:PAS domain S-box-containing protein
MHRKETILIVDDDIDNLNILNSILNYNGYKVLLANSAESALNYAQTRTVSLILLDIVMPITDGYQTCISLKKNPKTSDIPVIFMSAESGDKHKIRAFELGAVDYITKPFNKKEILARIQTHLKISKTKDELKLTTAKLCKIEDKYCKLIDYLKDDYFAYRHNKNGVFIYVSQSITNILGYSESEFKTHYSQYLTDNEVNRKTALFTEKALNGEKQKPYRLEIYHKNGEKIWLEVIESPIFSNGEVVAVEGIAHNVTENVHLQQKLEKSEYKYRTLVENSPDILYIFSKDTGGLFHSASVEKVLGYSREEIQQRPKIWYENIHEDDKAIVDEAVGNFIQNGIDFDIEYRIKHKSGRFVWLRDRNIKGALTYQKESIQGLATDITLQKEAEYKIKNFNSELQKRVDEEIEKQKEQEKVIIYQARLAATAELMNNIAHQWRQPLSVIGLYLNTIQIMYESDELNRDTLDEYIYKVETTLQTLSNTIENFNNFFKPNEESELFEIKTIIDNVLSLIESKIENIELNLAIDDIKIYGFKNSFSQAILHIISNAVEALERDSIEDAKISISTKIEKNLISIDIADNAKGIKSNIVGKIFEPYFTTKFKADGVGLGLYMTKMIIEKHMRGKIEVKNRDEGALFSIKIPQI